jgi:hypothetical protein
LFFRAAVRDARPKEEAMRLKQRLLSVIVCANAMLAGCASTPPPNTSALGPGVDEKRVAQVEAAARRSGVDVHWVNYPHLPGQ